MSVVIAVSQRYTGRGSGVRKWCDGGRDVFFGAMYNVISKFLENANDSRFMVGYALY